MRQAAHIFKIITVLSIALSLFGCGSDVDPLDELANNYTVRVVANDTGGSLSSDEVTYEMDVVQSICSVADDGTITFEAANSFYVQAEIQAGEFASGMRLVGYTFYFTPSNGKYYASDGASPDSNVIVTDILPPALPASLTGRRISVTSEEITAGDSLSIPLLVWSFGDKQYYTYTVLEGTSGLNQPIYSGGIYLGTEAEWTDFQYQLDMVFHCEDAAGESFDLYPTGTTIVNIADFYRCSSS